MSRRGSESDSEGRVKSVSDFYYGDEEDNDDYDSRDSNRKRFYKEAIERLELSEFSSRPFKTSTPKKAESSASSDSAKDNDTSSTSDSEEEELEEEISDTESSASETYRVNFPDTNATTPDVIQSLARPTVDINVEALNCTIRIGKSRPPTAVKGQGRHVSAYALMLRVVRNRLEGQSVADLEVMVKELIEEYVVKDANLDGFYEELKEIAKKHSPKEEDYKKRVAIYKADLATKEFLSKDTIATMKALEKDHPAMAESFRKMLEAQKERDSIAPMDVRNMIKRAQEAYRPLASDLIALTITILNRTTDAAKNFPQPVKQKAAARADDSDEEVNDVGESAAINKLEKGKDAYVDKKDDLIPIGLVGRDIAALFDYKYDLILKEAGLKESTKILRDNLYHAMRRHIKMVYDAFPFIQKLVDGHIDDKANVIEAFVSQVLEKEGWKSDKHDDFKSKKSLVDALLEGDKIRFGDNKCVVDDKSVVKKKHGSVSQKLNESRGGAHPDMSNIGKTFFDGSDSEESSSSVTRGVRDLGLKSPSVSPSLSGLSRSSSLSRASSSSSSRDGLGVL